MRVRCPACWTQYDDLLDGIHSCAAGISRSNLALPESLLKPATTPNEVRLERELAEAKAEIERLSKYISPEQFAEAVETTRKVLAESEAETRRLRWALTAIGSCSSDARTCELAGLALSAKSALNPEVPHA